MDRFDDLYRAHLPAVFRFALRCVGNRTVAEDLTAEAFLELYRHRERVDAHRLPAWLLTVVRNRARDYWRRRRVELRHAETLGGTEAAVPEPALETWLLESPDLKDVHRTCLILRYVEGMSRAEIAQATGLSENQVKGYLQYALTLVRKAYERTRGKTA
ncbi:MAG TPA: sigma-70 family RNA polymerase sigma factor [Vicinamibacterales bacterium]|jgi:RNA polymerase sigma-70 factor (ECF subfamily)|nr:sigma-70 family RNA polymerase sigma factor [Vicinamibacterales bacterium]